MDMCQSIPTNTTKIGHNQFFFLPFFWGGGIKLKINLSRSYIYHQLHAS